MRIRSFATFVSQFELQLRRSRPAAGLLFLFGQEK